MRKLMTHVSIRILFGFLFIVSFFVFGHLPVVKAEDAQTVEGVWEVISVSSATDNSLIGSKVSISRNGDSYEVKGMNDDSPRIYAGNERRIVRTAIEDLIAPEDVHEGNMPVSVKSQLAGKQVPVNYSYTLSADGNLLTREQDGKDFNWQTNPETGEVRNVRYDITPGYFKRTLKRVSGPVSVAASKGDHAYRADCGPTVPNRTAPITTDLCPGNLVAMTYFCGGDTGCPYVCCPKGLPYLNHCDCKCYATADFDCHSYSKAQEQPKQVEAAHFQPN